MLIAPSIPSHSMVRVTITAANRLAIIPISTMKSLKALANTNVELWGPAVLDEEEELSADGPDPGKLSNLKVDPEPENKPDPIEE